MLIFAEVSSKVLRSLCLTSQKIAFVHFSVKDEHVCVRGNFLRSLCAALQKFRRKVLRSSVPTSDKFAPLAKGSGHINPTQLCFVEFGEKIG